MSLTTSHKGYIAGIIDGEGSIGWHRARRPNLSISTTNTDLTDFLISKFGRCLAISIRPPSKLGTLESIRLNVTGEPALIVLRTLLPYLIIKQSAAQQVIDQGYERKKIHARTQSIIAEMRELGWG